MKVKTGLAVTIVLAVISGSIWLTCTRRYQEELDRKLLDAAYSGDLQQLRRLLKTGANPNASRSGTRAARHWTDYLYVIHETITHPRRTPGLTAIKTAALQHNFEIVGILAEASADPNSRISGEPLISYAIAHRADPATVRTLIHRGADVRASGYDGATALHWAALRRNKKLFDDLIQAGASVDARTTRGETPLMLAAASGASSAMTRRLRRNANR